MGKGSSRNIACLVAAAGTVAALSLASGVGRSSAASGVQRGAFVPTIANADAPVFVCFHPTLNPPSQETMAAIESLVGSHLQDLRYNENASWTGQGLGTELTWSFVPDGLIIPNGIGEGSNPSTTFATFNAKFSNNTAQWIGLFEQSFDRWGQLSGLTYRRVTSGGNEWDDGASFGSAGNDTTRGDIRIATKPIDGGGGVLAYNSFPTNSDMVLDSAESWQSGSNNFRFLRNTIMHEHGHGLGFSHLCPVAGQTLMEPLLNTSFDGPQHDDIRAVHRGYGDIYEPNDAIGVAASLGTLAVGTTNISLLPTPNVSVGSVTSLDDNTDRDFYAFSLSSASLLSATVTPIGRAYDDSDQFGNGNCGSGNFINSTQIHDLVLRLLDAGGNVILDVNANGIGQNESFTNEPLPGGNYFVEIRTGSTTDESQLYTLVFNVTDTPDCVLDSECDDGDPSNGVEVCDQGQCVTLPFADCNNNGLDDAWEIANGFAEDCNENGVPDSCDIAPAVYAAGSPNLSPIGANSPQTYDFTGTPLASTDVDLELNALGDFSSSVETVQVFVGGVSVGTAFSVGGSDCPGTSADSLSVPAATWNAARIGGTVTIDLVASAQVNPTLCIPDVSAIAISVSYSANAVSLDDNMNSIPDECENAPPCVPDLTTTGTTNGIPDGLLNGSDFTYFLSLFAAGCP